MPLDAYPSIGTVVPNVTILECSFVTSQIGAYRVRPLPLLILLSSAGSTGRCNTGLEFTRRSFKAQGLSRALI
jgi:hypothetical protein